MHHQISHGPSFALLRVDLEPGETLTAEAGAMVARQQQTAMEVSLNASNSTSFLSWIASLFVALIRKFIGGETFFVNRFTTSERGSIWIAPALSGHITHRSLRGETLVLSTGAYLAHAGSLQVRMKFGGIRGILAKEGLFFLEFSGHGELWFTSYGGIEIIDIHRPTMIDNGHLVGYEGQLQFRIRTAGGGLVGFLASGEGLVCEFEGQGKLYIRTRSVGSLVDWIGPLLPG